MADRILPEPLQLCVTSASARASLYTSDAPGRCLPTTLSGIQTELLLLILDYINLNGDVSSFGLTCTRFHDVIKHNTPSLLKALQTTYALPPLLVTPPTLPTFIGLQSQLHDLQNFPLPTNPQDTRASLLVTSHLHRQLTTPAHHSTLTITSPLPTLTATITTSVPAPYTQAIRALSLADFDAYIDGLNQCASALWQVIEAQELSALMRHTLALYANGDQSNSIDLERVVCAEIAIWRGVSWCLHFARDVHRLRSKRVASSSGKGELERCYTASMSGAVTARSLLARTSGEGGGLEKLWQGSDSEADKLASGGLAAWLCRERKARYEEAVELNGGQLPLGVRPCLSVGVP